MGKHNRNKGKIDSAYHIDSVNLEIDYEKLAKAIVKASNEATDMKAKQDAPQIKRPFWSAIWATIANKRDTNGLWISGALSAILTVLFRLIAGTLVVGSAFFVGLLIYILPTLSWSEPLTSVFNIIVFVYLIFVAFAILLLAVVLWGMANEIEHEKDRDYVLGVFSGIVSLAALIVALVALFRG